MAPFEHFWDHDICTMFVDYGGDPDETLAQALSCQHTGFPGTYPQKTTTVVSRFFPRYWRARSTVELVDNTISTQ